MSVSQRVDALACSSGSDRVSSAERSEAGLERGTKIIALEEVRMRTCDRVPHEQSRAFSMSDARVEIAELGFGDFRPRPTALAFRGDQRADFPEREPASWHSRINARRSTLWSVYSRRPPPVRPTGDSSPTLS